jgi:hypothetical protein
LANLQRKSDSNGQMGQESEKFPADTGSLSQPIPSANPNFAVDPQPGRDCENWMKSDVAGRRDCKLVIHFQDVTFHPANARGPGIVYNFRTHSRLRTGTYAKRFGFEEHDGPGNPDSRRQARTADVGGGR